MDNSDKHMLADYVDQGLDNEEIKKRVKYSIIEIVKFRKDYLEAVREGDRDIFVGIAESKKVEGKILRVYKGEKELKLELEKSAFTILYNLKNKINADSNVRDLKTASEIISSLNSALIKKDNPQVNIQNNINKSPDRYKNLLNDMVKIENDE